MAARFIAILLFDNAWKWQHGWQIKGMRNLGPTIFWPEPKKAGEWLPLFCIVFICNELEDQLLNMMGWREETSSSFMLAHNPELLACEKKIGIVLCCKRRDITPRQMNDHYFVAPKRDDSADWLNFDIVIVEKPVPLFGSISNTLFTCVLYFHTLSHSVCHQREYHDRRI